MTAKHPYPEHIRDKVALGLFAADCEDNPELDPNEEPHPGYYEYADTALQALWDASRVDDLPQVEVLPDDAVIQSADGLTEFARTMKYLHSANAYPAHVIYWGNHA